MRRIVDFEAPVALWTNVGGEVDPWRLAQALFARCAKRDFALYGRTEAIRIEPAKGDVKISTNRGVIRAQRVVVAAGYEAEKFLPERIAELHSSYAIVTEPVKNFDGWGKRCLVWESARPYLYARTTSDNRIIAGGEDDPFRDPHERDKRVEKKADALLAKLRKLFPRIEMELAYSWAGTFGETKDSLPFIGAHPSVDPRVLYALAYGANGMPFSAVAAEVLTATVLGKSHRYQSTFGFER
jgi:glycine/D-amino acid oxidase-like deaminating enzyme